MNRQILTTQFLALACVLIFSTGARAAASTGSIISFKSPAPDVEKKDPHVLYDLDPTTEKFFVWTPPGADKQTCGLIVFIHSSDDFAQLPNGWEKVLTQQKLMFIAPQSAGNNKATNRRMGLAALAARMMMVDHKIDPQRVYAAGLSGGSRMAGMLGFFEPDLFHGTIQSCGADFYEKVPEVTPKAATDKTGDDYGLFDATPEEIDAAKQKVRFAIITGSKDFRHASIVDIFHGGFEKAGFNAKLIDVPNGQHAICSGTELTTALTFIQAKKKTDTKPKPTTHPLPG